MLKIPKLAVTLNLTPDSFSDGGVYNSYSLALKAIEGFLELGVDIIDIGGESTRPNIDHSTNSSGGLVNTIVHALEWERIHAILEKAIIMVRGTDTKISLDSRNYDTFKKALDLGINIINDVSGLADQRVCQLPKEYNCDIIIMHNLGVPANPAVCIDEALDPVEYIMDNLQAKQKQLLDSGVSRESIVLDPGIGFGNNGKQAVKILKDIARFKSLSSPIMVGHSRKSFLNQVTHLPYQERDLETHIVSVYLATQNIDILRVHDLAGAKRAFAAASLVF
jgi:dihydropteroate synthase